MKTIPFESLDLHSSSGADWNGRLFVHEGGHYRMLGPDAQPFYGSLLSSGVFADLAEKGLLIETTRADFTVEGHPLVLKHRSIPFVSYPCEWTDGMLRDAALALVNLELELHALGLSNHDAHPWNVVFEWTSPRFVDIGAILPLEDQSLWSGEIRHALWPAYAQFRNTVLNPLELCALGFGRWTRTLYLDFQGISDGEIQGLKPAAPLDVPKPEPARWPQTIATMIARCRGALPSRVRAALGRPDSPPAAAGVPATRAPDRESFLRELRRELEEGCPNPPAHVQNAEASMYPDVHDSSYPSEAIARVILRSRPASIIDFTRDRNWTLSLAAKAGIAVVACEADAARAETLYKSARGGGLPILPVVMEFNRPTPGVGACNCWLLPATQRFKAEMVLALDLIAHLVFSQFLTFEQIAKTLAAFSVKHAVLEYVPKEDEAVRRVWTPNYGWYSRENCITALLHHFDTVETIDLDSSLRSLLVCHK